MIETNTKIKHAEDMVRGELELLAEGLEEGDEIEAVVGALQAVFKFTFEQSPFDLLAVNMIHSILSSVTANITYSHLEKRNGN